MPKKKVSHSHSHSNPHFYKKKKASLDVLSESEVTPEERHQMIAEAAYYRAQQRGFEGDEHLRDWLVAEELIDLLLQKASLRGAKKHHYFSS